MSKDIEARINTIVEDYFVGLHFADTGKLRAIFSPDCVLKAPGIRRTLEEWLNLVVNRPVPATTGANFSYQVLNTEIIGNQAMVKAYCPLLGAEFIDYLGLLFEDGQWRIVNKMYAEKSGVVA